MEREDYLDMLFVSSWRGSIFFPVIKAARPKTALECHSWLLSAVTTGSFPERMLLPSCEGASLV